MTLNVFRSGDCEWYGEFYCEGDVVEVFENIFCFLVSPNCTAALFCDSLLRLLSTLQGSVSVVVPDQMHWRGDADFPKVTKDDRNFLVAIKF